MSIDRSLAAFLGCAIGDAAGAPLEFMQNPTAADITKAMEMRGGGVFKLGPGQITDDTEMAIAQADGLLRGGKSMVAVFPGDAIAGEYAKWLRSGPFDAGHTCRTAFCADSGPRCAERMMANARSGAKSKSNGALVRCVPLCIYTARSLRETIDFSRRDCALSHMNPTCQNTNVAYCAALAHLLEHPKDAQGAIAKATATACTVPGAEDDILGWIDCRDDPGDVSASPGFVKHAFSLAFWHLRQGTDFELAIRDTISRGGDTNTNAAVVGGMLGAYHGTEGLPVHLVDPVLSGLNPRPRPMTYRASRIPELVNKLVA